MAVVEPENDPDADDPFDEPNPEEDGDDSELADRYGDT